MSRHYSNKHGCRHFLPQRCWATPVPRKKDVAELNAYLRDRRLKDQCVSGREHRDYQ